MIGHVGIVETPIVPTFCVDGNRVACDQNGGVQKLHECQVGDPLDTHSGRSGCLVSPISSMIVPAGKVRRSE